MQKPEKMKLDSQPTDGIWNPDFAGTSFGRLEFGI